MYKDSSSFPSTSTERRKKENSGTQSCFTLPPGSCRTTDESEPSSKTDSFSPHANFSLVSTCLLCMGLPSCFFRASPFLSLRFLKEPNAWGSALRWRKHPGRFSVCWKLTHKLDLAVLSLPSAHSSPGPMALRLGNSLGDSPAPERMANWLSNAALRVLHLIYHLVEKNESRGQKL